MAQCTATSRRSGERCKRHAHPGATVCVKHGAGAPAVKAAAARRLEAAKASAALARIGQRVDADPLAQLLDVIAYQGGLVAFWRAQVEAIEREQDRRERRARAHHAALRTPAPKQKEGPRHPLHRRRYGHRGVC